MTDLLKNCAGTTSKTQTRSKASFEYINAHHERQPNNHQLLDWAPKAGSTVDSPS